MPFLQVDDKLIVTYGKVGTTSLYDLMQTLEPDRVCTGNDAGITQGFVRSRPKFGSIKENFQDFGVSNTHAIIEPNKYWLDDRMPQGLIRNIGSINQDTNLVRITNAYNWIKHNADKKLVLLMRDPVERFHSGMLQFFKSRILSSLLYKGTFDTDKSSTIDVIMEGTRGFPNDRNWQDFTNTMSKTETQQYLENLQNPEWWSQTINVMLAVALPNCFESRSEKLMGNAFNDPLISVIETDLYHIQEHYHMGNYLIHATQKLHKHIDLAVDLTDLSDWLQSEQLEPKHNNQSDRPSWGFLVNNRTINIDDPHQLNRDIKQAYRTGMQNTEIWQLFKQYLKSETDTYKTIHRGKHIRVESVYHTENKET